ALDEDLDAVTRGALHGHGRRVPVVDDVRLYRADTLLGVDHVDDAIGGDVTEPDEQLRRPVPDVRHDHLVGELDDARRGGRVVNVVLDPVGAGTGEVEAAQEHGHVGQDVLPVVVAACQRETDVGSGPLGLGQRADGRQEDGAEYALREMKAPGR